MLTLIKDIYKQRRDTSIWTQYTAWMILKNKTVLKILKILFLVTIANHLNNATEIIGSHVWQNLRVPLELEQMTTVIHPNEKEN